MVVDKYNTNITTVILTFLCGRELYYTYSNPESPKPGKESHQIAGIQNSLTLLTSHLSGSRKQKVQLSVGQQSSWLYIAIGHC